ncbi:mitochondrial chaperone BCS1-B like protein [Verticillium longisporum]|nr:mitochondrial chaperone BCS1-B like protein [Verticillium longisporum]
MFNLTVLSVWIGNATAVALQPPTNITFYQSLPDANRYILSIANAISLGLWAAYTTASSALRSSAGSDFYLLLPDHLKRSLLPCLLLGFPPRLMALVLFAPSIWRWWDDLMLSLLRTVAYRVIIPPNDTQTSSAVNWSEPGHLRVVSPGPTPNNAGISWHERKPRPVQSLDSLFIDDKDELVADCLRFFEPSSQARRTGRGKLPYMGMLLYGRPGTGKSSFALAVAQHLGVPIYRPGSLSTYDDQTFRSLMSAIQQKCVILLEDIDTADVTRSRNEANTSGAKVDKACLGTILEELDSLNVEGGAMVMMTTNHMEKLDPALIRAGRVHRRVEFQLASRETAAALFRNEFKDEMAEHDLDQAAKKFAAQIPDRRFSPAQIDEFLHGKEKDLEGALEGVSGWVKSTEAADLQDSVVGSPSESDGP